MTPLTNSFWAGGLYLLAGIFGLTRRFLLDPNMPKYPPSPPWLLNVMFAFSAVLFFVGLRFLNVWWTGEGAVVPPGASGTGVLMAAAVFGYKGALLYNVLTQRYPVDTWARMNRVTDLARCSGKRK